MQVTVKVAIAFNNAVRGAEKEGVSCLGSLKVGAERRGWTAIY